VEGGIGNGEVTEWLSLVALPAIVPPVLGGMPPAVLAPRGKVSSRSLYLVQPRGGRALNITMLSASPNPSESMLAKSISR
jgi:hypothetical protein